VTHHGGLGGLLEIGVEGQPHRAAGHRLQAAEGRAQLGEGLASGRYDIVIAPLSETPALELALRDSPTRPFLLPVIHNPTGKELAEAQAEWSCVMRSPSTKKHYLAVIEDAMVLRQKGSGR